MKITTLTLSLFLTATALSQDVNIEWDGTLDDVKTELESTISLGENRAIIIPKTMDKPLGLKPFLYTYDTESHKLECQRIPNWKNMETYKEFFNYMHHYVGDENNIYRVRCEFGKKKKGEQPYSLTIDELDASTLRPNGASLLTIPEGTTMSPSRATVLLNKNYLAVIFGYSSNFPSPANLPVEVSVYDRENMELMYKEEYTLGRGAEFIQIEGSELKQNGEVHLVFIGHQIKLQKIADAKLMNKASNSVNYVAFTKDGVDENVFIEGTTNLISSLAEFPDGSNIGISFSKSSPLKPGSIALNTVKWDHGVKSTHTMELPFSDLVTPSKSSCSESFLNKIEKSDQLYVNVASEEQVIDKEGNLIQFVDFKITTEKGMGLTNTLFACFVAKIAPDGSILWVNAIPGIGGLDGYGVDYAALVDANQNIHVLSNGIIDEYPNGTYTSNETVEVNTDFVPIEIVINGADGSTMSNTIREDGFSSGEGFSPHQFLKLSNDAYLVGKNKKGRLVNSSSTEDLDVTHGVLHVK